MNEDVTKCIEILKDAIAFEEEGIRFFSEKAQTATSEVEKNLFLSLAKDEQGHRAHLIEMREQLLEKHSLEPLSHADDHEHRPAREIFESALAESHDPYNFVEEDLEILQGAMAVEKKGYEMYSAAAAQMETAPARELFEHLAAEEQVHFQLLHNAHEYIRDPEGWHGYDEGAMLDGG